MPCCRVLAYLQVIQGEVSNSSSAAVGGGLRPTEVTLNAGCIEEVDANYKGDLLSGVLSSVKSGDDCCAKCRRAPRPPCAPAAGCMLGNPHALGQLLCRACMFQRVTLW